MLQSQSQLSDWLHLVQIISLHSCIYVFLDRDFTHTETQRKFGNIDKNYHKIIEEELIVGSYVDIWVEAHAGKSSCTSPRTSRILKDTGDGHCYIQALSETLILRDNEHVC